MCTMEGGRSDEDTTRFDFHGDGMPEEEEDDDDDDEDDSTSISSSRSMDASTSIILARGLLPRRFASSLTEEGVVNADDDSRSFRRREFFETSARRLTGLVLLRQLLSSSLNIKMTSLLAESTIVGR